MFYSVYPTCTVKKNKVTNFVSVYLSLCARVLPQISPDIMGNKKKHRCIVVDNLRTVKISIVFLLYMMGFTF